MQLKHGKSVCNHGRYSLSHYALPPIIAVELVADFRAVKIYREIQEATGADGFLFLFSG